MIVIVVLLITTYCPFMQVASADQEILLPRGHALVARFPCAHTVNSDAATR